MSHLRVDAFGFPLQVILTGGERHDLFRAESLITPFHFDAVIAVKGYSSDLLRKLRTAQQVTVVTVLAAIASNRGTLTDSSTASATS